MRKLFVAAIAASVLIGSLAASSQAQHAASVNAAKHGVAVVDVGFIFKGHARFLANMDMMKKEMEAIEEQLKAERSSIEQKEKERDSFNLGTPEYKQADENVTRMKADFNVKMTNLRKNFLDREAKAYFETYTQVNQAVAYYCQKNNIVLVLRFNGDPDDSTRREGVLQAINKQIVYQDRLDITPDILAMLNQGAPAGAAPANGQPGVTQPGVGVGTAPAAATRPGGGLPPR